MPEIVRLERPSAHVARATINRPPVNALDTAARQALIGIIREVEEDHDTRCLVVTGAGKMFCAGADLKEEAAATGEKDAADFLGEFGLILIGLKKLRVPVIAAINGPCLGGGLELALSCDLRIAARSAKFVASGVNVGMIASFHSLVRTIGTGPAASMLLTGFPCDAERAAQFGLITGMFDDRALADEALALAERIASRSPLSVEANKRCIQQAPDLDADEALTLQAQEALALVATKDHAEALTAFFEKRPGRFKRR